MSRWNCEKGVLPEGAFLDDEDLHLLEGQAWSRIGDGYVGTPNGVYLHRLIMPNSLEVDHRNGNGLDNRRENLRPATHKQNLANQRPQIGRSSRFKGVCWRSGRSKWQAYIKLAGEKQRHLGYFDDEVEAAKAYNSAAVEAWGEFARPNSLEA